MRSREQRKQGYCEAKITRSVVPDVSEFLETKENSIEANPADAGKNNQIALLRYRRKD